MAVGINSVREICIRCPLAMTPELLQVRLLQNGHGFAEWRGGQRDLTPLVVEGGGGAEGSITPGVGGGEGVGRGI